MVLVYLVVVQCLLVGRMSNCQFIEISVVMCLIDNGVCLVFCFVYLIRGWVFWQWDQDVVQVQFSVGVVLVIYLLCQGFDFLWQDGDVMMYFVVMYFRDNYFFVDLVMIGVVVQFIVSQMVVYLIQCYVVLFCDVSNCLIQLFIGDFYFYFLFYLQDDLIYD